MKHSLATLFIAFALISKTPAAFAQGAIAALDTSGITYQVDHKTGALTERAEEALAGFTLGGTVRREGKFYYVAKPAGTSEYALYTVVLKSGAVSHVDLDRDDEVRAMFFKGKKLFAVLYNGDQGTAGLYRINIASGATTLILDLSSLDVEPIAGAFSEFGKFYYMLSKPESDTNQRRLLRFKAKANSAALFEVTDSVDAAVLCNKLKPNIKRKDFVCMASNADETEVSVCRLKLKGQASCSAALLGIERVGSGHTMLSIDHKNYYAFVYVPGEENNQHLIKFSANGSVKSNVAIETISIGAHFKSDGPPGNAAED